MGPQIIFSARAPVGITKSQKVELRYVGVCVGVLNRMKGQMIQRKTAI